MRLIPPRSMLAAPAWSDVAALVVFVLVVGAGAPVELPEGPEGPGAAVLLPPSVDEAFIAFCWKAAKVCAALGFTANTMPAWQWFFGL